MEFHGHEVSADEFEFLFQLRRFGLVSFEDRPIITETERTMYVSFVHTGTNRRGSAIVKRAVHVRRLDARPGGLKRSGIVSRAEGTDLINNA